MNVLQECPLDNTTCVLLARIRELEDRCKELEALSQVDALTSFYNYRYLVKALSDEMERTMRTGLPTGLIMVDLDHFKRINDVYGHESGNRALKKAASIWRAIIRRIDIPCRYGGEEFVIVLPGTRLPQAVQTAERLRQALESQPIQFNGQNEVLTGSFGVAAFKYGDEMDVYELIEQADQFVFRAKEEGRNRVCFDKANLGLATVGVSAEEREHLVKCW